MNYFLRVFWSAVFTLSLAGTALAHEVGLDANVRVQSSNGGTVTYREDNLPAGSNVTSVEIIAFYSTGKPMSGAQVTVFAPGDRATPWRKGVSNRQGRYSFTPDLSKRGRWTIKVEASGHSNFINLVLWSPLMI